MPRNLALSLLCLTIASIGVAFAKQGESPTGKVVPIPSEKPRQFDFWLGKWDVANRHLKNDGSWREGGAAKAEITSVLGGKAILEQWTGQGSLGLRGFSLRTYDAEQDRWEIVLNWHSGAPSSFSYMVGKFSDQRGEFFPPTKNPNVRFTFSKATTQSCQWDQATSNDGMPWKTNWVMQFSKTASSQPLDAGNLPISKPLPTLASRYPKCRTLDHLIGVWQGPAKRLRPDGTWQDGVATRRVSSMIDGLALLQMTRYSWGEQSIAALSFNVSQGKWYEVGMSTVEPDCHWLTGDVAKDGLRLNELPTSNNGVNHVWSAMSSKSFHWAREQKDGDKTVQVLNVRFTRSSPEGQVAATQVHQQNSPNAAPPSSALAGQLRAAQGLLGQQKFPAAEKLLGDLVKQFPNDPRPHYLLGYAFHLQKKYPAAMKAYAVAAKNPRMRPLAKYNMACICSLQNKNDEAFEHLGAAVQAGFKNFGQLAGDADFANIRNDARFQKLLPKQVADDNLFVEPTRIIHKFVGESAGGQFGWTARRAGDWDQDGVEDFVATAPTHAGSGKVYVYSSRSGKLLFQKQGQAGEQFGNSAVGAGDIDGDNSPDLLVGAPSQKTTGNAYAYSSKTGKLIHHFKGQKAGDRFGYEVSELGDIDDDGHADILVGAVAASGKKPNCGKVYVYSGKTGKKLFEIEGERTGDSFGNAAACSPTKQGHLLAIGAQNAGPNKRGRVYVYLIGKGGAKRVFTIEGDSNSVNLGQMFIAFPGDVNRDGTPDIYASDFSDNSGARGAGKVVVASGKDGKTLLTIKGARPGEGLGTSPSDAGDVNGDGVGDLVIGAWQHNSAAPSGGKVYLHDGKTGRLLRAWTCRQAGDTFGFDACGIGDVDGDGNVDFLLTSAWSNTLGPKTGRVFILAGDKSYASDKTRD